MTTEPLGTQARPSPDQQPALWTRDFTLITLATILGAAGGIAGDFALSFFVFDETGSTLASALVIAIQLVPHVLVPLAISPFMDRLPRKAFLVAGDLACGLAYAALGRGSPSPVSPTRATSSSPWRSPACGPSTSSPGPASIPR